MECGENMVTIIICGSKKDEVIAKTLYKVLCRYGKVYHDKVYEPIRVVSHTSFYISEVEHIPESNASNGILIFKNTFEKSDNSIIPNNFTIIMDPQNTEAAQAIKGTNNVVITCGMLMKSTLSISSLDFSSAIISVQRSITDLSSKLIEPHDFAVLLRNKMGVYPILAVSAALMMLGVPSSSGYEF